MHPCGCRWHRAALWLSSSLLCIGGVPSIHSAVSELLGCPRDLAAVNSAAENFGVHVFFLISRFPHSCLLGPRGPARCSPPSPRGPIAFLPCWTDVRSQAFFPPSVGSHPRALTPTTHMHTHTYTHTYTCTLSAYLSAPLALGLTLHLLQDFICEEIFI